MSAPRGESVRLSYSKLRTYRECNRRYKFKYIDRLPEPESREIRIGTLGHLVLADYYNSTEKSQELINVLCTRHAIAEELDEVLKDILKGYHEWASIEDKDMKILEIEKEYNSNNITGKIDLLAERDGTQFIIDHKFKGQWAPSILEQLLHDEQTKTYSMFTGVNKVCYNLIRTKEAKTRPKFERICVLVPQTEVNRLQSEYPMWEQKIENDTMFLRNRGVQCVWCPFKENCYNYET